MMFDKEEGTDLPTHSFLAYKKGEKWCWFEHSFGKYRGIHEYGSLEDMIEDIKKKKYDEAVRKHGATSEDLGCLKYYEYKEPEYGSGPEEFVAEVFKKSQPIINK